MRFLGCRRAMRSSVGAVLAWVFRSGLLALSCGLIGPASPVRRERRALGLQWVSEWASLLNTGSGLSCVRSC